MRLAILRLTPRISGITAFAPAKQLHASAPVSVARRLRIADEVAANPKKKKLSDTEEKQIVSVTRKLPVVKTSVPPLDCKWWTKKPVDDVWLQRFYPPKLSTFRESIEMHRQFAVPEMLNNENGLVIMSLKLCMSTKKKTKFSSSYGSTILLPHEFEYQHNQKILAFSKNPEDVSKALAMGAALAGGLELIQQILTDELDLSSFNVTICTVDLLPELVALKEKLSEFPAKSKGTTGKDMETMMTLFSKGFSYKSVKCKQDGGDPAVTRLHVPVGRLSMPVEHLEDNWSAWKTALAKHRASPNLGPIILTAKCMCLPSPERIRLRPSEYGHLTDDIVPKASTPTDITTLDEDDSDDEQ